MLLPVAILPCAPQIPADSGSLGHMSITGTMTLVMPRGA
jgi:hypothetical protein